MGIVANNSYRYNYEMELWLLKNYTAKDLLDNWNTIYEYASAGETEEDVFFLADCLDVISEKLCCLSCAERKAVLGKVKADVEAISIGDRVLRLAG